MIFIYLFLSLCLNRFFAIATSSADCQHCISCVQGINYDVVNCKQNTANTAIVDACKKGMNCYNWQMDSINLLSLNTDQENTPEINVFPGSQILFAENATNVVVNEDEVEKYRELLSSIGDLEEAGIMVVNWIDTDDDSFSGGEDGSDQLIQLNNTETTYEILEKRSPRDDANKICSLLSASRNGAFTRAGGRTAEFCIGLSQQAASAVCRWYVKEFFDAQQGLCSSRVHDEL